MKKLGKRKGDNETEKREKMRQLDTWRINLS